tara:strand:- start:1213 stop:2472 length:1260 start_codon:yes stop_codon:yes gene_type:complete
MLELTQEEKAILNSELATTGDKTALSIVVKAAEMLGAKRLVKITSSHIDGCLYHGDSGVLFCENLAKNGAKAKVPTTTNVGALNFIKTNQAKLSSEKLQMAQRLMDAHINMGCTPSWTCAPYQIGARPKKGEQVAWGESNAVAFANTVLGARTNRYGDFLDIACAVSGRAPYYGLHCDKNRNAEILLDVTDLPENVKGEDTFFPVLGSVIGRLAGDRVCAVSGINKIASEDQLKALCAAAASTGAVGLVHIIGITPEATNLPHVFGNERPKEILSIDMDMMKRAFHKLSQTKQAGKIDCVALGSPHFSISECKKLLEVSEEKDFKVPVYVCTNRHTAQELKAQNIYSKLERLGVVFIIDTCVVVTPILPGSGGIMMTNSAKFAHYSAGNTGYRPIFGSLVDCIKSAQNGYATLNYGPWK